ncbi:hypothetical protein AB0B50_39830 [Streptomyces sp. NPDC041068]|uniref:hypothetical protein n=1 Tax=Streptomyces sp. NPDC041068 TaxID=3155130 RepID=UPI0033CEC6F4
MHRVRILVAVIDDPEEIRLAEQLLGELDWPAREWDAPEARRRALDAGRKGMVVEAHLRGNRHGVVRAVVRTVEDRAKDRRIGMWVLDAVYVGHDHSAETTTTYEVKRRNPTWYRPHTYVEHRVLTRPGAPRASEVGRQLTDSEGMLLDAPHDAGDLAVHVVGRPSQGFNRHQFLWDLGRYYAPLALVGGASSLLPGYWPWATLVVAVLSLSWTLGEDVQPVGRPTHERLAVGAFVVLVLWVSPFSVFRYSEQEPVAEAVWLIPLVLTGFAVAGVWWAVRGTWLSRTAHWTVPALVPVLALVLPWLGQLQHAVYLRDGFGIPADSVAIPVSSLYAATLLPLATAGALFLLLAGSVGVFRYMHWLGGRDQPAVVAQGLLFVGVLALLITPVWLGVRNAGAAAADAKGAARDGRAPAAYFGAEGRLMCVRPLKAKIPVFNGPLPSGDRPLLTFGASGDRLWFWDPRSKEALSVRAEDVSAERC